MWVLAIVIHSVTLLSLLFWKSLGLKSASLVHFLPRGLWLFNYYFMPDFLVLLFSLSFVPSALVHCWMGKRYIYCTFCLLCACQSNFESPGYWNIKPCLTTNSFYPSNSTVHWKSIKENQKWLLTPSETKQILFFSLTSFSITITDVLMKSLACCSC